MDTATEQANGERYLDQHLREVVARHERQGALEICGVSVGPDLSPYYPRRQALDLSVPLGNDALREIVTLLRKRRPY